jgi:signal transduction histidine kinase
MYARSRWILLLITYLITSCHSKQKTEKEEEAFWVSSVIDTSHKVLYKDRNPDRALRLFDSLQQHKGKVTPYINAARFTLKANYHWFFTGNNDSTGMYIDSGLAVFKTPELQQRYPRSYVGFLIFGGEVAFRLGNFTKSNEYFFQAKQSSDKFLDPCDRSRFTYNVAMVSYRQQNFAQSALYFKEAYASQATCPIQTTAIILQQQEIQSNIGLCLFKLKQYDSAVVYFNKALQIADLNKDSLGTNFVDRIKGVVYGNMAKIAVVRGNLKEAEALFIKSIKLNGRPGYEVQDALLAQVQLAEVYHAQHRLQEMKATLQAVRVGLDSLHTNEGEINWKRLMAAYYNSLNQPEAEFHYFKGYVALRDSISANQTQLVQADITRQLKDKAQAIHIVELIKHNQLNEIYLWVTMVIIIMAVVILLLIYQNYKRSKRNIATLTNLNNEITRQKQALEITNKEKDRILQVVAHDLRNPIGITAYVADLALMEDGIDDKTESSLHMIKTASQQALSLTNELLGLRTDDEDDYPKETIDIVSFIKNLVHVLYYKAEEKGQSIKIFSSEDFLFVNGNPERLNRMASNLLLNAIKFSHLQETITIRLTKEGKMALIAFEDNGIGIADSQKANLFDRFTKTRKHGTSGEKSFGLGLSICRDIVEKHNGTIHLESIEGEGATFFIRLPLTENA